MSAGFVLRTEKSSQKGSARAGKDSVRAALFSLLGICLFICTIFNCEKALNELATPIIRRVLTKTERLTFSIQQLKFKVKDLKRLFESFRGNPQVNRLANSNGIAR